MKKVSVVLNTFRRPHSLKLQYDAILNQSIKPQEIFIWKNDPENDTKFNFQDINACISVNNANYGVWSRFAFALNTTSDYICVFDDDTIPGENWFKNCIDCIENQNNGLYGTIGVNFLDLDYNNFALFVHYLKSLYMHEKHRPALKNLVFHHLDPRFLGDYYYCMDQSLCF